MASCEACDAAIDAAEEAQAAIAELNELRLDQGEEALRVGIAISVGEVMYGNVGAADRLDFTVIGPAVNEAARIEALCTPIGHNILISEAFATAASTCSGRLVSVGRHALRGVAGDQELFTMIGVDAEISTRQARPVPPQPQTD